MVCEAARFVQYLLGYTWYGKPAIRPVKRRVVLQRHPNQIATPMWYPRVNTLYFLLLYKRVLGAKRKHV